MSISHTHTKHSITPTSQKSNSNQYNNSNWTKTQTPQYSKPTTIAIKAAQLENDHIRSQTPIVELDK